MITEKRHGKTLHRVDRIKLPGIYMNPQSFPQQSMRNLAYVEFIKTRGLQSLSVILWVSAPPNQIPCELFPATDRILIQFKLKFSMWVCSPFHIKVIFEYKSYLYTHTTFMIKLRLYICLLPRSKPITWSYLFLYAVISICTCVYSCMYYTTYILIRY